MLVLRSTEQEPAVQVKHCFETKIASRFLDSCLKMFALPFESKLVTLASVHCCCSS